MIELWQGDCLELMKNIPDGSVDLILTDPPFGVEYSVGGFDDSKMYVQNSVASWLAEMYRVLKDGTHCYIFIPVKEVDMWVGAVKRAGFEYMNLLATKTYTTNSCFKNNFTFTHQPLIYCSKGTAKPLNRVDFIHTSRSWLKDKRNKNPNQYTYSYPAFMEFFSNQKSTSKHSNKSGRHPCAKNVDFIEFLVQLSTNAGDTVLDMFMGGGSTGVACVNTGRNFIGIELDAGYFNIAKNRIKEDKSYVSMDD